MSILFADQQTLLIRALGETATLLDLEQVEIRNEYSGRSMYGQTCIAVSLEAEAAPKFLLRLGAVVVELANNEERRDPSLNLNGFEIVDLLMDDVRIDDMGLGSVIYFPSVHATA